MTYQPNFIKKFFHNSRRFLAKTWLSFQPATQIAITGSQGKTNTSQLIAKVLSSLDQTVVTDINLDTVFNVPITALKVTPWTKFAVFELGVDHPNEMDLHLQIVKPKIAIITGISSVHTDKEHLGSLEKLIREKRKLIEAIPKNGYAILNWDDENVRNMSSYTKAKILWFGTDSKNCDIWGDEVSVRLDGTSFLIHDKNSTFKIKTRLIGKQQVYNIMAAYLIFKLLKPYNISINQLIDTLKNASPLPGRMSVEMGPAETIILNDSLRANPQSTAFGLQTFSEINYLEGRKIAILAEMGELEKPEEEHKKIGKLIGQLKIDYLIAIGPLQKYVAETALANGLRKEQVFWVKDVHEAAQVLKKIIKKNDLLYLKGSLLRHVERVILILQKEKVGCKAATCPFYNHCSNCQYLQKGYASNS